MANDGTTVNARVESEDTDQQAVGRRNLLRFGGIAAAGAAAAAVASVVDASPAGATTGAMQFGESNDAGTDGTSLSSSPTSGTPVLSVTAANPTGAPAISAFSNTGVGVAGFSGFRDGDGTFGVTGGAQGSGTGVQGSTFSGVAVEAAATVGTAINAHVDGESNAPDDAVEVAHAGTGRGLSVTLSNVVNPSDGITVTQNGTGKGINVATTLASSNQPALLATSAGSAAAVRAVGRPVPTSSKVAVAGNANALTVQGVASFTRSGTASIAAGHAAPAAAIPVPGGLSSTSHVLAMIQTAVAGNIAVKSAVPNAATGKITITLTANAPTAVTVAWFVFG